MTENERKSKIISDKLKINNGVIVSSGTIALMSALKLANIKSNDNVLINGYCCYSLFEAIANIGAKTIFVVPNNFYNISYEEIDNILKKFNIKCFIATHQYGIVQDIKRIKENYPNLIIIEDIAQAWNIKENELGIGNYSDFVVTSFGISKPLSYGQAGAIFSNNDIIKYFDLHNKDCRNSKNLLLPYALYDCEKINTLELVKEANIIVDKQREIANYLTEYFYKNKYVNIYKDKENQLSSWHRFPIIIKQLDYIKEFESIMEKYNILYQWQNEKETYELDMINKEEYEIISNTTKPKYALIRTRQNNLDNVKKLIRR